MNIWESAIKKQEELREAAKRRREAEKERLETKLANINEQMKTYHPITFKMAAAQGIEEKYLSLLKQHDFIESRLENLKDVKKAGWYEPLLYFLLEVFMGIFVIYTLLYRVMGEEYFSEITMTFGLTGIDPLYIALGFEALVIVMFATGIKLFITSRFNAETKAFVKSWTKWWTIAFLVAYGGFVYLSNI